MKTIRYFDVESKNVHLGILEGDDVYSLTSHVPYWTDPMHLWYSLRALNLTPEEVIAPFQQGETLSFEKLQQDGMLLPPVYAKEVWAAGVTYERSRDARNMETKISDSVYDRVYEAERPELFFKATANRVVSPGRPLRLRSDSNWMVPEPELSLVLSNTGDIVGWTIGNDLSSRDIEGENPLYLPQAKVFADSCSFGPVLLWNTPKAGTPSNWNIRLDIERSGSTAYSEDISFSQFRRSLSDMIEYLKLDNPIPDGTVLMTGTGLVPPDEFTLQPGDTIHISIDEIGTLVNPVLDSPLRKHAHDSSSSSAASTL